MWLTPATWLIVVGCKVLQFIDDKDQEVLGYKTLRHINVVASHRVYKFQVSASILNDFKISLIYD